MSFNAADLKGISCMVMATGAFVANDTCMKLALGDLPPMQVLVLRGLAACLWCVPLIILTRQGKHIAQALNPWVVLRAACEVISIMSFIMALRYMPLADVTAIYQIAPFLVLIGSSFIWHERIGGWRMLLIAIGILGALMIAQPGAATASPYALLGFLTATGSALRDLAGRKVPIAIPGLIVALTTLVVVMLLAMMLNFAFEPWVPPSSSLLALMVAAGFFLMCGHTFIFLAFRYAKPTIVAPFYYSLTLWAVLFGAVVFHILPNGFALLGMVLIIGSGLTSIALDQKSRSTH